MSRARKVLKGFSQGTTADSANHPWARVVRTFESRGLTEEDALVQARVARILREGDYDFAERQPILWSPD